MPNFNSRLAPQGCLLRWLLPLALPLALAVSAPAAHAVDGCKLLLCLAGSWKKISACQPVVRQALRDVARGRSWPSCSMESGPASGGNRGSDAAASSGHEWTYAPGNCPEQYWIAEPMEMGTAYRCRYDGVVNVWVSGRLWSRLWWTMAGDNVTQYSAEARAQLGASIDPSFDNDHLAWLQAREAAAQAAAAVTADAEGS